jgi:hypothetical protein
LIKARSTNADQALEWPSLKTFEQSDPDSVIPTLGDILEFRDRSDKGVLADRDMEQVNFYGEWFLQEHSKVMAIKRLFMSDKGYIGLTSISAQPGDRIAFMPGSDVPFLIRTSNKSSRSAENNASNEEFTSSSQDDTYILIGEVYIHGLMHGELFKDSPNMEAGRIVLV